MTKITSIRYINKWLLLLSGLFILSLSFVFIEHAKAASLTETFIRFDRIQISTPTTGTVCVNQTSGGTDASVQVTFPAGYTVNSTAANWTVTTTNVAWPSGGTAWPGIGTATTVSGQTVTFPSTTLTPSTLYCFNWSNTAALTTSSSASNTNSGTIGTYTVSPTLIDSGSYVASTVTNDQIAVSATIPVAFSFALSGNTDSLGSLTTASVSSSPTPRTVTLNTNAHNGWQVWAKDANTGLTSSTAAYTLASTTPGSNSTLSAGTAGYNMGVTSSQSSGSGSITVATPFVGGSTGRGGGLNTTLATIASSNGTGGGAVLTVTNNTAISATTPAASDYADTITIVGAGLF
jgi:hypothetical protein